MRPDVDVVPAGADVDAEVVVARVLDAVAPYVLVVRSGVTVGDDALAALVAALGAPLAATASPMPVASGPTATVDTIELDPRLPPVPTVARPSADVCLLDRQALSSIHGTAAASGATWATALASLGQRLVASGWRHVAAPGTALAWGPDLEDPANEALDTHRRWAATRSRPVSLVVDGECLSDDIHNGSQAVVWNTALALTRTRPDHRVTLAVPAAHATHLAALAEPAGVSVVVRDEAARGFDVVYRPYQPLTPAELPWLLAAGDRLLTSQLDMIAFANPTYHPSPALFHTVRNLQRLTMRIADGVTFISEFGRQVALAECADLDASRTFVVSCGVDVATHPGPEAVPDALSGVVGPFVACASATFWHKNRQHAILVFDRLCRDHGYAGQLVIAGPEPYYGRSTDEDARVVAALDPDVRRRVVFAGRLDEASKWWLLAHADVVLYPSVVEGFGLIPFEAASVGTPALCHRGSALVEVLGATSAVVAGWSPDAWAERAAALVADPAAAAALVDEVLDVARGHTWDQVASAVWDAVDATLARPRAGRFADEGGLAARVASRSLAPTAGVVHFANRLKSYAERRLRR